MWLILSSMIEEAMAAIAAFDRHSCADMLVLLSSGEAEATHLSEEGVIVSWKGGQLTSIVSFTDDPQPILSRLDPEARLVCVHDELMFNLLKGRGYECEEGCFTFSWEGGCFKERFNGYRHMRQDEIGILMDNYALADEEELNAALERQLVDCLEVDGQLVGFVGFHPEGSMGMLTVLPQHRGHGYGEDLEKHDINRAIAMGRIPYCHVFFSNKASFSLQHKLGLAQGRRPCYWLFKP